MGRLGVGCSNAVPWQLKGVASRPRFSQTSHRLLSTLRRVFAHILLLHWWSPQGNTARPARQTSSCRPVLVLPKRPTVSCRGLGASHDEPRECFHAAPKTRVPTRLAWIRYADGWRLGLGVVFFIAYLPRPNAMPLPQPAMCVVFLSPVVLVLKVATGGGGGIGRGTISEGRSSGGGEVSTLSCVCRRREEGTVSIFQLKSLRAGLFPGRCFDLWRPPRTVFAWCFDGLPMLGVR